MKTYLSSSSAETERFAETFAKRLIGKPQIAKRKSALVIALEGELGSGKTTFIQGFLHGLGVKKRSPSPTFIIFRRFKINDLRFKNLYHVDAYRIKDYHELVTLGFRGNISDPHNIVLIEWADKIRKILPRSVLWIKFRHGKKENERVVLMR